MASARALISPGGLIRLSVDPKLALASAVWLLRPRSEYTRRMLQLLVGEARAGLQNPFRDREVMLRHVLDEHDQLVDAIGPTVSDAK